MWVFVWVVGGCLEGVFWRHELARIFHELHGFFLDRMNGMALPRQRGFGKIVCDLRGVFLKPLIGH
jgi:hypothetical protein